VQGAKINFEMASCYFSEPPINAQQRRWVLDSTACSSYNTT